MRINAGARMLVEWELISGLTCSSSVSIPSNPMLSDFAGGCLLNACRCNGNHRYGAVVLSLRGDDATPGQPGDRSTRSVKGNGEGFGLARPSTPVLLVSSTPSWALTTQDNNGAINPAQWAA